MSIVNPANPLKSSGSGGDSGGEVYSTEEVRIGTWIDGKPLYRLCVQTTLYPTSEPIEIVNLSSRNIESVTLMSSICKDRTDNSFTPSGYFNPTSQTGVWVWIGNGYILKCRATALNEKNTLINTVIEYTKTTD